MSFTLQIQCVTLDEAERIIDQLKSSADAAAGKALAAPLSDDASVGRFGAGSISELKPQGVPAFVDVCASA